MKVARIIIGIAIIGGAIYLAILYGSTAKIGFMIGAIVAFIAGICCAAGKKGFDTLCALTGGSTRPVVAPPPDKESDKS